MRYVARVSAGGPFAVRRLAAGMALAMAGHLAACGPSSDPAPVSHPPANFAYAYASPDCAPWDGPAVRILLTTTPSDAPEDERPQLRLVIYPREIRVAGRTYRWPAEPEMAIGARCTGEACESASAGEIRLAPARPDSALEGTVTLRFGPSEVISGGFHAVWRPQRLFCG
jgi:hypothetical protein